MVCRLKFEFADARNRLYNAVGGDAGWGAAQSIRALGSVFQRIGQRLAETGGR